MLVEYTVALVEYTRLYKPYRKACDYLEELLREQEDDAKQAEIDKNAKDLEKEKVRRLNHLDNQPFLISPFLTNDNDTHKDDDDDYNNNLYL